MKELTITLPDRLVEKISESDREPSEIIIEALNKYTDPSYHFTDLHAWQAFVEKKLTDLQVQLDKHVSSCKSDIGKDFDNDLRQRQSGEKSPLDLNEQDQSTRSLVGEVNQQTKKRKSSLEQVEVDLGI
jgi:hypothetical protein